MRCFVVALSNVFQGDLQPTGNSRENHGSMTKCCKCNAAGSCSTCRCAKNSSACINCIPGTKRRCKNGGQRPPFTVRNEAKQVTGDTANSLQSLLDGATPTRPRVTPVTRTRANGSINTEESIEILDENSIGEKQLPVSWRSSTVPVLIACERQHEHHPVLEEVSVNECGTASPSELPDQARTAAATVQNAGNNSVNHVNASGSSDDQFHDAIASAYEQVVHWRRNVFNVPYGAIGADFVDELATLISSFADCTKLQQISWKSVCVACHLLLQKPSATGSASSHGQHLQRRLSLWRSGCIPDLLEESMCIQRRLPAGNGSGKSTTRASVSDTVFSKLVFDGKIHSALRYIAQDFSGGVLSMDDHPISGSSKTVHDLLLEKHPEPNVPPEHTLMSEEPQNINPIVFDRLTPELLRDVARHAKGSAGPSGLDSDAWRRMITCFKQSSNRLCAALARAARRLCTNDLTEVDLSAFTAARLVPLDKNPGLDQLVWVRFIVGLSARP